jgi:hypothetical protein
LVVPIPAPPVIVVLLLLLSLVDGASCAVCCCCLLVLLISLSFLSHDCRFGYAPGVISRVTSAAFGRSPEAIARALVSDL